MNGILGSSVLDVAIGLAFIYLLLAVFTTTVNEWISGMLNKRGQLLEEGLRELLDDQAHPAAAGGDKSLGFLSAFQKHPLIANLDFAPSKGRKRLPAYLAPSTFATAVMDLVTVGKAGAIAFSDLEAGVKNLDDGDVKTALLALLQNCNGDLNQAQQKIEAWFNDFMDRVTGWYKRWIQILTLVMALLIAAALNADSLRLARNLWQNTTLRNVIVEQAKTQAAGPPPASQPAPPAALAQELKELGPVLGWTGCPQGWSWQDWLAWLFGVVITTIAASLGAPFWFDTLQRFVNLRSAGKSPDERAQQAAKASTGGSPQPT